MEDLGILMVSISNIIEKYINEVIGCRMTQILFTGKTDNISNDKLGIFAKYINGLNNNGFQTGGVSNKEKILNCLFLNEIRAFKELVFFTALQNFIMELILALNQLQTQPQLNSQRGGVGLFNTLQLAFMNITLLLFTTSPNQTVVPVNASQPFNDTQMSNALQLSSAPRQSSAHPQLNAPHPQLNAPHPQLNAPHSQLNAPHSPPSNELQPASITKKTQRSLSIIDTLANNGNPMFSRDTSDLSIVQAQTQLKTPEVSGLMGLFFKNTEEATIKKIVKQFNTNMTEITEECEKACLAIVDSIMDKTTTFDFKPEEELLPPSPSGNSLAQLTSGIMGMLTQSTQVVSSIKPSKSEQLQTLIERKKIKQGYSQYLKFECHEAYINKIKYDGTNLTMIGGNIKYDQILSQQLFIETSLREQLETEPDNRIVKSTLQRFMMLTKVTEVLHVEMTHTFISVANKITGEEDAPVKFEKHLTSYVKSINDIVPYLKMLFPVDTLTKETVSEFKQAEFDNIAFASMSDNNIRNQQIELDKRASELVTKAHAQYVDSTAHYVKELTKSTADVVIAPVIGAAESVGENAHELTGKFVQGLSSMVGKIFYGPIGIMILITFVFVVMCWVQSIKIFMSPFVIVKNAAVTIIRFTVGNVYYVFEKVRTQITFKGIEKKHGLRNTPVGQRYSALEQFRTSLQQNRLYSQIENEDNEEYVDLNIYRPPLPYQPPPPRTPFPYDYGRGFKKSKRRQHKSRKHNKSRKNKHTRKQHKSRK